MADKQQSGTNEAELATRLTKLETVLQQNEQLRSQTKLVGVGGALILLFLLSAFAYRIYDHVNVSYLQPLQEDPVAYLKDFAEKSEAQDILQREAQTLVVTLQEETLKTYGDALYKEFTTRLPEIESRAGEVSDHLIAHAQEHVEQKLNDALADSIELAISETQKALPELDERELIKHISVAREEFVNQLHDSLEHRYAKIEPNINGLKDAVNTVEESATPEQKAMNEGALAEALLDAIIDVIIYELKPELGKQLAAQ